MSLDKKNNWVTLQKKLCEKLKLMLNCFFITILVVSILAYMLEIVLQIFCDMNLLSFFNMSYDRPLPFLISKLAGVDNNGEFSLEPATVVITAFGAGGVTLSAVNEAKAKKSHGVPMADAIDYFFHCIN